MERSLREGENLEFFIEGSRSRSGKPNSPKAGLLSVLVDCVKEGGMLLVFVGYC
jgi:glycerol-3-phosphate O-acyltransferase